MHCCQASKRIKLEQKAEAKKAKLQGLDTPSWLARFPIEDSAVGLEEAVIAVLDSKEELTQRVAVRTAETLATRGHMHTIQHSDLIQLPWRCRSSGVHSCCPGSCTCCRRKGTTSKSTGRCAGSCEAGNRST